MVTRQTSASCVIASRRPESLTENSSSIFGLFSSFESDLFFVMAGAVRASHLFSVAND
jgi:hypothetical protein